MFAYLLSTEFLEAGSYSQYLAIKYLEGFIEIIRFEFTVIDYSSIAGNHGPTSGYYRYGYCHVRRLLRLDNAH